METHRSLISAEPAVAVPQLGHPAASRTTAREERLFDQEVDRAAERAGGPDAVDQRLSEVRDQRRGRRHAGFGGSEPSGERGGAGAAADRAPAGQPANPQAPPSDPAAAGQPLSTAHLGLYGPSHDGQLDGRPAPQPTAAAPGLAAGATQPAVVPGAPSALGGPGTSALQAAATPALGASAARSSAAAPVAGNRPGVAGEVRPGAATAPPESSRPLPPEPPLDHAHEILRQLRVHLSPGVREATLSLVPAELGRLQVRLSMADGKIGAVVKAESPETLELLERHLPELRAALEQQGLDVADFQLELGFRDGGGPADTRSDAGDRRAAPQTLVAATPDERILQRLASTAGGIDTYA